jgi:hypothetical protein
MNEDDPVGLARVGSRSVRAGSPWPWLLIVGGLGILLALGPKVWTLYAFVRLMDPDASAALVRNLDELTVTAELPGQNMERDPEGMHPVPAPDSLINPHRQIPFPRSHDVFLTGLGVAAVLLGLSVASRRALARLAKRPGPRLVIHVWHLIETLAGLALALLVAGGLYAILTGPLRGAPLSWAPIDDPTRRILELLAAAQVGS